MIAGPHRHEYDDMLAREAQQAGFSPKWIPVLVPLCGAMLAALVFFIGWLILYP